MPDEPVPKQNSKEEPEDRQTRELLIASAAAVPEG
jgi:hypothetical protein